jgi:hypothetical protein
VALILLTSVTLTISVYAARHHHGNRSIEDGYQTYGLSGPPLSDQVNAPPVSDQANGNGNGNNPVGNQVNAPPVSDQANGNGNGNNPVGNQVNAPPVSDQANGNGNNQGTPTNTGAYQAYGNGNNPVGNQVNAPPVSDQANGNGNNPVGKEQIQTHAPTITYKSTSNNDMLMHFANVTQPLCGAGICSQSSTNH